MQTKIQNYIQKFSIRTVSKAIASAEERRQDNFDDTEKYGYYHVLSLELAELAEGKLCLRWKRKPIGLLKAVNTLNKAITSAEEKSQEHFTDDVEFGYYTALAEELKELKAIIEGEPKAEEISEQQALFI
jgi:hypothetical protein